MIHMMLKYIFMIYFQVQLPLSPLKAPALAILAPQPS